MWKYSVFSVLFLSSFSTPSDESLGTCSKEGDCDSGEEKSLMLDKGDDEEFGEVQGEENEGDKEEGEEDDVFNVEEVQGIFNPCTVTEASGQLQRIIIKEAGYKISEYVLNDPNQ